MKTVVHTKRSKDDLLHIETEGGIINVRVGLSDSKGRPITSIEILPDRQLGDEWKFADKRKAQAMNIRLTPARQPRTRTSRARLTR